MRQTPEEVKRVAYCDIPVNPTTKTSGQFSFGRFWLGKWYDAAEFVGMVQHSRISRALTYDAKHLSWST